jgi:hypothetical protein
MKRPTPTGRIDCDSTSRKMFRRVAPSAMRTPRTLSRWFNTAGFSRATMTYGNSPRNPVVGPGLEVVDLSLAKSFRAQNGQQLQFRWKAFNAVNTPQWGNPNGTLGNSNFGIISSTRQNNREMQISLKYTF